MSVLRRVRVEVINTSKTDNAQFCGFLREPKTHEVQSS